MKRLASLLIVLLFIFIPVPATGAEQPIDQQQAAGYAFSIVQDDQQKAFLWTLSNPDLTFEASENSANKNDLSEYRDAIYEMDSAFTTALIAGVYFILAVSVSYIFFKRNKNERSSPLMSVIAVMIGISVYVTVSHIFEYQQAFRDAEFYFYMLAHG